MKKSVKYFNILSVSLAFLFIAGFLFAAILLEPAVRIRGFENLNAAKLSATEPPLIYDGQQKAAPAGFLINNKQTSVESIPKHVIDSFIAAEDVRFYEHPGVDYYRIAGATYNNIRAKGYAQGASTITQQLIKNTHLSSEKKLKRKVNEVRMARALERKYSKTQIMEMYLNRLYFGNNVYGIGAAAQAYFDKRADALTVNESAFLAGVINNPSRYNPAVNPQNANARRRLVLSLMLKNKLISREIYDENLETDVLPRNVFFEQYSNFLLSEASTALGVSKEELLRGGSSGNGGGNTENSGAYKIYSYLDADLQQKINSLLRDYDYNGKNEIIIHALVMKCNGEIIADCSNSNTNLTGNYRQPGSIIKPAVCYAPAFEKRLIVPVTPILDEPADFNGYAPHNHKDKNLGWISVSEALKQSQNIPAVKLTDLCGIDYCKEVAEGLGYTFDLADQNLAIALGGMTKGITLAQAANSYQAFANGGEFVKASHIAKITDTHGRVLYRNPQKKQRAVSKETAYFINEILTECALDGTAKRIGTAAAKTGTVGNSNGNTDAYVVAYTRNYVVAVWFGPKNGLMSNSVSGGTHPSVVAKNILNLLPPVGGFDIPDRIEKVDIDAKKYLKEHRVSAAAKNTAPKDRLNASFVKDEWPIEEAVY